MAWPCFWVLDTGEVELSLRRLVLSDHEPAEHYHDASVAIGNGTRHTNDTGHLVTIDPDEYSSDPRWPTTCSCGYEFTDADYRQVNQEAIYTGLDDRAPQPGSWAQQSLPAGALFDSWWAPADWRGPDGRAVTVVLPDLRPHEPGWRYDARSHFWNVDGCATPRDPVDPERTMLVPHAWTRHGNPDDLPSFSVTPSIDATVGSGYHGFLTNGELTGSV